jgi:hypothetical protein
MPESFELHLDDLEQALMISEGSSQRRFLLENYQSSHIDTTPKKILGRPQRLSEEQSIAILNPAKASDLLLENSNPPAVASTLENLAKLRTQANRIAHEIVEIEDPKYLPLLERVMGPVNLSNLNQAEYIPDTIREKLGLLALHKYLEFLGPNFENYHTNTSYPPVVEQYHQPLAFVQDMLHLGDELSREHPIFNEPLQTVVKIDEKWQGQDEVESFIHNIPTASQVYRSLHLAAEALRLSQIWDQEGIAKANIARVDSASIIKLVRFGIRYFSWYTLFDDEHDASPAEQIADFDEIKSLLFDPNHPAYLGRSLTDEQLVPLRDELLAAEAALFE